MAWSDFMTRLIAAAFFGAVLGFERQWRHRMAGLVTNTLVSMGAAIFVMFSLMIPGETSPTRVAAQVVSGIGFLGGGVILQQGLTIRGLNTAATLWCAAALGILAGGGYVIHGLVATVCVTAANIVLPFLCDRLNLQSHPYTGFEYNYQCEIIARLEEESLIRTILLTSISGDLQVRSLWSQHPADKPQQVNYSQLKQGAFSSPAVSKPTASLWGGLQHPQSTVTSALNNRFWCPHYNYNPRQLKLLKKLSSPH